MVIVGGGAGALAAAISAVDAGLEDVVVLDPGDTASLATDSIVPAIFVAADTELQREAGIDDSVDEFADWWMGLARGNADRELVEFLARESSETVSWLQELGVGFLDPGDAVLPASGAFIAAGRAHVVDGGYRILYEVLHQQAVNRGVDIRTNAPVSSLILDEAGRVEGVRSGADGREERIFAYEAVVLTGRSRALSGRSIPLEAFFDPTDTPLDDASEYSDGIALAEEADAAVSDRTGVTAGYMDGGYRQARIGGLDVTETSHVMRSDGSTIPRLYATGRIAGNRYFYRLRLAPQSNILELTQARVAGEHVGRYRRGG